MKDGDSRYSIIQTQIYDKVEPERKGKKGIYTINIQPPTKPPLEFVQ